MSTTAPINWILVVDDDEGSRDRLQTLLTKEDCEVVLATDGFEALAQASAYIPDLILLDVMMPGLDGYEVCRRLRADPVLAEVPVIMVTALDDRDSRLAGIEVGADDFISKPYDRIELRVRVRAILRLNRYRKLLGERLKFEWVAEHTREAYVLLEADDSISYSNPQARRYLHLDAVDSDEQALNFLKQADCYYHREAVEWRDWRQADEDFARPRYLTNPQQAAQPESWLRVEILTLAGDERRLLRITDVSEAVLLKRQIWMFQDRVSHKLLTPLNGLGILDTLNPAQLASLDQETQSYIRIARDSAHRLCTQILEIIDYTVRVPQLIQHSHGFLVSQLADLVQQVAEQESVRPQLEIAPQTASLCLGMTAEAIELVLRELLNNARKFHPQHQPAVTITLTQLHPGALQLSIGDDGLHLPSAELAKMLTPYYQIEKNVTGEVEGMGLGLPMVATLLRGLGGHCSLHNRSEGPGLIVTLEIPELRL